METTKSAVTAPQRFAVPVNPGKNERPEVWVEGAELCAVADGVTERRYLGEPAPAPAGAEPGALWVEVGNFLHYVGEDGEERRLPASSWVEDFSRPHWLRVAPGVEAELVYERED